MIFIKIYLMKKKIGYKTKLGDAVINEINKYLIIQFKDRFKVIKEDFIINDQASYIYTLERVNINSVSPVLESALYDELVEINLTRDTYNIYFIVKINILFQHYQVVLVSKSEKSLRKLFIHMIKMIFCSYLIK